LELENGRGIPFQGNYTSWLVQKSEMLRRVEKQESQRQKILARELEWINSSPEGRRKKGQARVARYDELSGRKFETAKDDVTIQIPPGPRLGDKVLLFEAVSKGYGGQTLVADCSFNLPRGAVVGVIGPNGCGKTTLFRMIAKLETPDQGRIVFGDAVLVSHVDQHRDALNDGNSVFEEITGGAPDVDLGGGKMNSRAYLSRFNFRGASQQKMVGQLSGGERNRVHLAKLLKSGGNLLLLDEPTNVLEDGICDFAGCAMVISHDRFFLDRICTHLLVFEGNGKTRWFEGNFKDYEERVLAKDGDHYQRRRNKYRRLSLRS
jgi:ATPase subunit of ABC transporter with duplicated ATPase domains